MAMPRSTTENDCVYSATDQPWGSQNREVQGVWLGFKRYGSNPFNTTFTHWAVDESQLKSVGWTVALMYFRYNPNDPTLWGDEHIVPQITLPVVCQRGK